MSATFLWHDYETFGIRPSRDRPAQFAAVRTDMDLNEVGAAINIHCQPAPDGLPQPAACMVTGITPQHCMAVGLAEHQFAAQIEQALGAAGTIGVGYNTIRFDDEVTRFLFWRNLIPPYDREWRNDCGRWDILDVVRTAYALRPEGINWPRHTEGEQTGKPSFKLEHLTAANGIAHDAAHDALSDVRATVALARLIKDKQPKLFEYCLKLRDKRTVLAEMGLPGALGKPLLHVTGMVDSERGCIALVFPLAQHPTNKNEIIVWDLRDDPSELASLNAAQIRDRLFVKIADLPEGVVRLPIKTLHINKSPMVFAKLKLLSPEQAAKWGIDTTQSLMHADHAAALPDMSAIWQDVFQRDNQGEQRDVDADLYNEFLNDSDRRSLDGLRALNGAELAAKLTRVGFQDGRLDELVWRYRARNFPTSLSEEETQAWREHCAARVIEGAGGNLSIDDYLAELDVLSANATPQQLTVLEALGDYAHDLVERLEG